MKHFFKCITVVVLLSGLAASATSCKARDCKGRKKTAKTAMGGWL